MKKQKLSFRMMFAMALVATCLFVASLPAAAQTESVVFAFGSSPNDSFGDFPIANVTLDSAGNLYTTTQGGGTFNDASGTVLELSPSSGGGWSPKVLAYFGVSSGSPNGGVIFDAAGNLYGVTVGGGAYQGGVVYELMPQADGSWTEKWLHQFGQGTDGSAAIGNLVFDSAGNLYGVTVQGGLYGQGTVYELIPHSNGLWTEKILHNFSGTGADGASPQAGVIFDSAGNLYGTTLSGGANQGHTGGSYSGTVFELSPTASGNWKEKILYSFPQSKYDAAGPFASVVFDSAGNLYGTTAAGGQYFGRGTVFELSPTAGGAWTETILHSFGRDSSDGIGPYGNLIIDSTGSLYGTTSAGGKNGCFCFVGGTVFKLTPGSGGTWIESIVHAFGIGADGNYPLAGVVMDSSGNLFGTTRLGGLDGDGGTGPGTVFEISR